MAGKSPAKGRTQPPRTDDFKSAAKKLKCDEDAIRFEARLGKPARTKPISGTPLSAANRDRLKRDLMAQLLADAKESHSIGYPPTEFLKMLERGAVEACTQVIMKRELPSGFARLYQLGRLDLTAEAATVNGPWWALFPPEVLDAANSRLSQFGRPDLVNRHPSARGK